MVALISFKPFLDCSKVAPNLIHPSRGETMNKLVLKLNLQVYLWASLHRAVAAQQTESLKQGLTSTNILHKLDSYR